MLLLMGLNSGDHVVAFIVRELLRKELHHLAIGIHGGKWRTVRIAPGTK
jgi:hypothetical protein